MCKASVAEWLRRQTQVLVNFVGVSSILTGCNFFSLSPVAQCVRKFGRVVKALALGASLERGTGSNPVACRFFLLGKKNKKTPVSSCVRAGILYLEVANKSIAVPQVTSAYANHLTGV